MSICVGVNINMFKLFTWSSWRDPPHLSGRQSRTEPCCISLPGLKSPSSPLRSWVHKHQKWEKKKLTKEEEKQYRFRLTWLVVVDISKEEKNNAGGDESGPPGEQEHQDHRAHSPKQSCPFGVVVKWRSPTFRGQQRGICYTETWYVYQWTIYSH